MITKKETNTGVNPISANSKQVGNNNARKQLSLSIILTKHLIHNYPSPQAFVSRTMKGDTVQTPHKGMMYRITKEKETN